MATVNMPQQTPPENGEPKSTGKVIKGKANVRKRGAVSRFLDIWLDEDPATIAERFLKEVLKPGLLALGNEALVGFANLIFPNARVSTPRNYNNYDSPSYRGYVNQRDNRQEDGYSYRHGDYRDLDFTYDDATNLLADLRDSIAHYGQVSLNEFYDKIDMTCPWPNANYGWKDLSQARVKGIGGGRWKLLLPPPVAINGINR